MRIAPGRRARCPRGAPGQAADTCRTCPAHRFVRSGSCANEHRGRKVGARLCQRFEGALKLKEQPMATRRSVETLTTTASGARSAPAKGKRSVSSKSAGRASVPAEDRRVMIAQAAYL